METEEVYLESTGLYGHSKLQRVRLHDNKILQHVALPNDAFGEGVAVHGGSIYQLTWREGKVYKYSQSSLAQQNVLELPQEIGEGWGICSDGTYLYISEGSNKIFKLDPATWTVIKVIEVTDGGRPITYLNELEFIDGEIWANIWYENIIVRFDAQTGNVDSYINLENLEPTTQANSWRSGNVLNGIAKFGDRLLVTGKRWNKIYEIELLGPRIV
mmetsp:Transcript_23760/g.42066  ORF Transcript_23760/g.42066 Transcript_23760/m.42066 type:complete len:215 (-) Transcript_23760:33-677(-)